jgi:hypothetical protein
VAGGRDHAALQLREQAGANQRGLAAAGGAQHGHKPVELELGKQLPDVFIAAVKEVGVLLLKVT